MNESTLDQTCRTMEDIAKEAHAQGRREAERDSAELLAALQYMLDVFHDDPESGRSMQHAAIEQAQDTVEKATKP